MHGLLLAAAALAGAASTLPHVLTEAWWLGPLSAAVLAAVAARLSPWRAAVAGWLFGTAWLAAATWWLFISLHRYGGLPAPLAVLAVLALAAALSLYWAAALAAFSRWRVGRLVPDILLFAALWLLAELARGQWFTGFPWAASGYAQVDGPLAAWAPWVGVYGIGALVAGLGAALAGPWLGPSSSSGSSVPSRSSDLPGHPLTRRAWAPLAAVVVMVASPWAARDFTRSTGTLSVSLVQTGVSQDEKFDPARLGRLIGDLHDALDRAEGELVVAPETAVPVLPQDLSPATWAALTDPFTMTGGSRAALVGLPLMRGEAGYTNSVVAWDTQWASADRPGYRYDKHHLVPFGEFIPRGFRWFVDLMHIPLGDFDRGALVQPSWVFGGQRIAPNICYEDLFGEELARRFHDPNGAPTMMVNLSNIAWFGPTIAIDQHLHISRLRSLELQRPMLRATNTGATAVIDHRGRVRAWLEPQRPGVLEARAEGREGLTPYARWAGVWGLGPLWALAAVVVGLMAGLRVRRGGGATRGAARGHRPPQA